MSLLVDSCFICAASSPEPTSSNLLSDSASLSLVQLLDNSWSSAEDKGRPGGGGWRQKLDSCPRFWTCTSCKALLHTFNGLLQQIQALEAQVVRIRDDVLQKLEKTDAYQAEASGVGQLGQELTKSFHKAPEDPEVEIKTEMEEDVDQFDFGRSNTLEFEPEDTEPLQATPRGGRDPSSAHVKLIRIDLNSMLPGMKAGGRPKSNPPSKMKKQEGFTCNREGCGRKFCTPSYLRVHIRSIHDGEHRHECPHPGCEFRCWHKGQLKSHQASKHRAGEERERPFICEYELCGAAFAQRPSLRQHIRSTHTGERPYVCKECPAAFFGGRELLRHKERHGEKIHQCPQCGKRFAVKEGLRLHIQVHDDPEERQKRKKRKAAQSKSRPNPPAICEHCGKQVTSGVTLRAHVARFHSDCPPPQFQCEVCDKKLSSPFYLRTHVKIVHEGAHRYECPEAGAAGGCGFKCWNPHELERHIAFRHRGEKRHVCAEEGCGAAFVGKYDLEVHRRSKHTGERPYACEDCSWRGFSRKQMRAHRKLHEK